MILKKRYSRSILGNKNDELCCSKLKLKLKSFIHETKGIAAVEFGLVMPFVFAFLLGAVALFDGFQGKRAFERGSIVTVDLVTRQNDMDDEKFDLVVATARSVIGKYADSSNFEISVTSIENEFDSLLDPTLTVGWSKANVTSAKITSAQLSSYQLPSVPEGGSIIMVVMSSPYTPIITTDAVGIVDYYKSTSRRPRFVELIPYL